MSRSQVYTWVEQQILDCGEDYFDDNTTLGEYTRLGFTFDRLRFKGTHPITVILNEGLLTKEEEMEVESLMENVMKRKIISLGLSGVISKKLAEIVSSRGSEDLFSSLGFSKTKEPTASPKTREPTTDGGEGKEKEKEIVGAEVEKNDNPSIPVKTSTVNVPPRRVVRKVDRAH